MSMSRQLHQKITLAIYDHKSISQRANQMLHSLKEIEKTLDSFAAPKTRKGDKKK